MKVAQHLYGIFSQDEEGPLLRAFSYNLEEAKQKAQSLSEKERLVCLVFDLRRFVQMARITPTTSPHLP